MPLLAVPEFSSPWWLPGGHLQTIIPSMARRVADVRYRRERLELPDGDFLDVDWSRVGSRRLVIISHGLEGDSHRHYARGFARAFNEAGWDALAWNCRSCSGEMNRLPRFYHHAATDDLAAVVQHALAGGAYAQVGLVGVSMGGSMTLKYLGENGRQLPAEVLGGVAFSVPVDLAGSEAKLARRDTYVYTQRFLRKLKKKLQVKLQRYPGLYSLNGFDEISRFQQFDDRYTAPLHNFESAQQYYRIASSKTYFDGIDRPVLIVNALNDPFLSESCYPYAYAGGSRYVHLEVPVNGGHVGFTQPFTNETWSEQRAVRFLNEMLKTP